MWRSHIPAPGTRRQAFIALTGAQTIAHIGVTDVWATGVWLAPYRTDDGGGGNIVVKDNSAAAILLQVQGTGPVTIPYLTGAGQMNQALCFDSASGLLGKCLPGALPLGPTEKRAAD